VAPPLLERLPLDDRRPARPHEESSPCSSPAGPPRAAPGPPSSPPRSPCCSPGHAGAPSSPTSAATSPWRGIAEWLQQAPHVAPDAIGRLLEPVEPGRLWLLRRGQGELSPAGADLLASVLAADDRPVVADCGRIDGDSAGSAVASILAAGATRSLLVVRPCFLALHRAAAAPIRPTGVVLLREEGRAIAPADVEHALGVPVVANVRVTDQIARSVDAGLLRAHLPRTLAKDLAHAA
jgi:hypothetical protein